MIFRDRQDAGGRLAQSLHEYANKDAVVLALPRGGVVVGAEVARVLRIPLGVVLVRKISHPTYAEYAIGAVVEDEPPTYEQGETEAVDPSWLRSAETEARNLLAKRHHFYYDNEGTPPNIEDKLVILVDDGMATGLTMRASVQAVRHRHPAQIIVAVPVASREAIESLSHTVDEVRVLDDPRNFVGAIGGHYGEFDQVEDAEVKTLLREANEDVHTKVTPHA